MKRTRPLLLFFMLTLSSLFFSDEDLFAKETKTGVFHEVIDTLIRPQDDKIEGYTINFQSVSILEYMRFISKVCHVNFIYNKDDLQFTITVVSDEKITPDHLMTTLIQMLRIHGLSLLEENGSFVVHKNDDVKQLATFLTEEEKDDTAPLITRVFFIENQKVDAIATVIKAMVSKNSILQTIPESNQLIITDINSNVDRIKKLIDALDAPQNPLVVESYVAKNASPKYLIGLLEKLIVPLKQGQAFYLIPQDLSNTIYIITTKKLGDKALSILSRIDIQPAKVQKKAISEENVFIYQTKYKSPKEVADYLDQVVGNLKKVGFAETGLISTIDSMHWSETTRDIVFVGSKESIDKLKEILTTVDVQEDLSVPGGGASQFLSYQPQNVEGKKLIDSLEDIAKNLQQAKLVNAPLIKAIKSAKWVPATRTLLFTGNKASLAEIKTLLVSIDTVKQKEKIASASTYIIYKLQHTSGDVIEEDIEKFVDNLKAKKTDNPELIDCLENMRWIKETNSLMLTGNKEVIDEAEKIIAQYDDARQKESVKAADQFYMYKPQHLSAKALQSKLEDIAASLDKSKLADPAFLKTIQSMKYVSSSQSLVFTGNKPSLEKIKTLLSTIDIISKGEIQKKGETTYLVYNVQKASPKSLLNSLQAVAKDFQKEKMADKNFITAINSGRYDSSNNTLVFTGTSTALEKIKPLLEKFDVAAALPGKVTAADQFYIYKPQYYSGPSLENILKEFIDHLEESGFVNQDLYRTIQSMRYVEKTNSLLFTGNDKTISEVKTLLSTFDVPGREKTAATESIQPIDNTSFLVYKLQYHKGDEIQGALRKIAQELIENKAAVQKTLISAINTIQWIQVTNSLLCTGDQETMTRLKELIKNLDIPLKQVFIEMLVIETSLSNLMSFGLQWGGKIQLNKVPAAGSTSNFPTDPNWPVEGSFPYNLERINGTTNKPTSTDIPFQQGFDFGVIGDILMHKGKSFISLGSLVNALQTDNESTIVLTPKIITQDSKTSTIFIGSNVPYVGSSTTNFQSSSTQQTTQNLEYRDVGTKLVLTPVLGNADIVTLTISLDNTALVRDSSGAIDTSGSQTGITTNKASMNTTVHIPNKHFLVLSGMVTENKQKTKEGIPCLGGLPLIGHLFSKSVTNDSKDNLVVFIRPHIINSFKDMVSISEGQEDFFRENAGNASLEKNFDETVEMLKIPDDE